MQTTINQLLEEARRGLRRLTPRETWEAMQRGSAVVIDTRSEELRRRQGVIPGARHYPLSVLEWRLCPSAGHDAGISHDERIVVVCAEGYSSSLAAARLQALGFAHATDMIDGVAGWRDDGLPIGRCGAIAS